VFLRLTKAIAQTIAPEVNTTGDDPIANNMSLSMRSMALIVQLANDTNISKAMVLTV